MDVCVVGSNKPTAFLVKLDVESLMTRNHEGILASTETLNEAIFDLVIGNSEFM